MTRLRKAAFVLAGLPHDEARALLTRLPTRQLEAVVTEIATLGPVWSAERRQALAEFTVEVLSGRGLDERAGMEGWAADWIDEPRGNEVAGNAASGIHGHDAEAIRGHFSWLTLEDPRDVASRLQHERPQVAAIVAAQLPQRNAMGILAELPGEMQVDVIRRMATLPAIDPEVLADLASALRPQRPATAPLPVHAATAG